MWMALRATYERPFKFHETEGCTSALTVERTALVSLDMLTASPVTDAWRSVCLFIKQLELS